LGRDDKGTEQMENDGHGSTILAYSKDVELIGGSVGEGGCGLFLHKRIGQIAAVSSAESE
jgi:hypothetical protein